MAQIRPDQASAEGEGGQGTARKKYQTTSDLGRRWGRGQDCGFSKCSGTEFGLWFLGPVGVEDALIPLAFRYQIYQSRSANKPCPAEMLPGRPLQNQSDLFRALSFLNRPRATWCVGQVTDAMALSDSPAAYKLLKQHKDLRGRANHGRGLCGRVIKRRLRRGSGAVRI